MTEKTRKTFFRYVLVVVLLQSTLAGLIRDNGRWIHLMDPPPLQTRTTTVQNYWLRVKEGSSYIDENFRIDTKQATERFHILPFEKVDEAIILSDFNKNWTIIKLPKTNQCFLHKLNPSLPPPKQLQSSIEKVIALNGTKNTIKIDISEKSTWKVQSATINRQNLTKEMNQLCANIPIYEIERTSGQLYLKGLKRQERSPPFPRSACGGYVCSHYWKWFCKDYIPGKGCIWVRIKVYGCQTITC